MVQDMSTLVIDNANFIGEVMDDQDWQWYTHMDSDNIPPVDVPNMQVDTPSSATAPYHQQIDANSSNTISDVSRTDFIVHSSHNRQLSRMSSEQALDYFLDNYNVNNEGSG